MNILVTGGSGHVGRGVATRLVNSGHAVRVLDWRIGDQRLAGAEYVEGDITHFAGLREQVRGMEGIIHLAAVPNPTMASGTEIFQINCWGTYNVFEAAAQEGIRRVACASSINALGYNFGVKSFPIVYFPMDEDHPLFTTDPYSFSKQTIESIAAYYWRRDGISSTCLRMPFVVAFDDRFAWAKEMVTAYRNVVSGLLSFPEAQQRVWLEKIFARLAQERRERFFEKPWDPARLPAFDPVFLAGFGYTDFWSIIAVEDAAQAFEKSLLAEYEGSHPLFVSQRENTVGVESEALLRLFYPEVTKRTRPIPGAGTLLSYDRAAQLIGFEPEVVVRERLA
jgi:nucleoside-diphosphate-sugar epimerase